MATWEVGQTLVFGLKVYDTAGALADLGGGNPTATLTKPDGTTASATVAKASTGTYTASYTASALGRWRCAWAGSGTNSGGLPYTDVADVLDMSRVIISLADARAALNVAAAQVVNDDELRLFVVAATAVVEHLAGPQLAASTIESRDGDGKPALALFEQPVAITSVVENGTTLASTDYYLDSAGCLWRGSSKGAGTWSTSGRVVVTYTVGGSTIDPNVIGAARWLVAHWWRNGQQSWRPPYASADLDMAGMTPALGYAIPNAVVDMLAPSITPVRRASFA